MSSGRSRHSVLRIITASSITGFVAALVGLHCFSGILFFASDARDLDDEKVPLVGGRRIAPADGYRYAGGPTYDDDDDDPAVVYEDLGGGSDEEELPIPTARAFVL